MSEGRVSFGDPGWLDTLPFAGASEDEIRRVAVASRPGLLLHDDPLGFVRGRRGDVVPGRPALAFLPDAPATVESYDALFAQLAPRWNVAALEIPGFGYSWPRSPAALEFEETVRLTADALAALGLGPAILAGPCVQGFVAIAIARTRPELVRGVLVLQCPDWVGARHWGGKVLDPRGVLARPFAGQIAFRLGCERTAVDWWAPFAAGPAFDVARLQDGARRVIREHGAYALASLTQKWFGRPDAPVLSCDAPATVIWGLADRSHEATQRNGILSYIPQARFVEIDGIGHFADLEAPAELETEAHALLW